MIVSARVLLRSWLIDPDLFVDAFIEADGFSLLAPLVSFEDSPHVRYEAGRLAAHLCSFGIFPPSLESQ